MEKTEVKEIAVAEATKKQSIQLRLPTVELWATRL